MLSLERDVQTTERTTVMAAGIKPAGIWGQLMGRSGCSFRRGWLGGVAGALLGALAMAASAVPASAQEQYFDKHEVPPYYRSLAVAYLAAPYKGTFAAKTADFKRPGGVSPGTALIPRFLKDRERMGELWEGIPIGLFNGVPSKTTRLKVGPEKGLDILLYAFIPVSDDPSVLSIKTFNSDAWKHGSEEFSVLTDTTFVLYRTVPHTPLTFGPQFVACVNKRTGVAPVCNEKDEGGVIEDPLYAKPALLMLARGGPPEWLKKVRTEICVAQRKGHAVRAGDELIPLNQADGNGERWCSEVVELDYIALRQEGLQIGSLKAKTQLDSRFAPESDWRMLGEAPREHEGRWVQRIVFYPPKDTQASKDPAPPSQPPTPPSSFELVLSGAVPSMDSIRKLRYVPIPGSSDVSVRCENERLVLGGKDNLAKETLDEAQKIEVVLPGRRLRVTEREGKRLTFNAPLAVLAYTASGVYCGVAKLSPGRSGEFTVSLVPSQEPSTSPKTVAPITEKEKTASAGKEKAGSPKVSSSTPKRVAVAPGPPVLVFFESPDKEGKKALTHGKVPNEDGEGVFHGVDRQQLQFELAPQANLVVVDCDAKPLACHHDGRKIELLPKDGAPLSGKAKQVKVIIDFAPMKRSLELTVLREGPAPLSIEQVSPNGQVIDRVTGSGPVLTKTLQWSAGDKLRVRPAEPDVQKMSAVTVSEAPWELQDDKHVEVSLPAEGKSATVVVKTADRRFSGLLTVTARGGSVAVAHGEKPSETVEEGAPRQIKVDGAKHGDLLSIRPTSPEFEVAKVKIGDGQKQTAVDVPGQTFSLTLDRSYLRPGDKLAAVSLDVEVREIPIILPIDVLLKPSIRLGKRLLPLQSCKVTLTRGSTRLAGVHSSKGTLLTFGAGQSVPKSGRYAVVPEPGASPPAVCRGLEAEGPIAAAALNELGPDRSLKVPLKRPGSRAFVGIVNLSKELRSKEQNWRSALEAVKKAFEAANERNGKYIWRAIYGPDGKALVKSETADETDLSSALSEIIASSSTMERLTDGSGLVNFETLLVRAGNDVAEFEGNVDLLIVSDTQRATCGWSTPPYAPGGRAVLVRLASFSTIKESSQELKGAPGVRICNLNELSSKQAVEKIRAAGIVAELEVVPGEWSSGVLPHIQLERAIAEAAKSLFAQ